MPKSISRRSRVEATAPINPSAMPMSVNFPGLRTRLSMARARSERYTNAQLLPALRHGIEHHAINPDQGLNQGERGKETEQ